MYNSRSPTEALFPLKFLPEDFLTSLKEYQHFFIGMQMEEIKENLQHFHHMSKNERKLLHQLRNHVAFHYLKVFDVRPIEPNHRIVPESHLDGIQRYETSVISQSFGNKKRGSYNQRHQMQGVQQSWLESVRDNEMLACNPSACLSLKGIVRFFYPFIRL